MSHSRAGQGRRAHRAGRIVLLSLLGAGALAIAQDATEPETGPDDTAGAEKAGDDTAAADDAEVIDDEAGYDREEEDFRPSEEIGLDEPIAFPTDI